MIAETIIYILYILNTEKLLFKILKTQYSEKLKIDGKNYILTEPCGILNGKPFYVVVKNVPYSIKMSIRSDTDTNYILMLKILKETFTLNALLERQFTTEDYILILMGIALAFILGGVLL